VKEGRKRGRPRKRFLAPRRRLLTPGKRLIPESCTRVRSQTRDPPGPPPSPRPVIPTPPAHPRMLIRRAPNTKHGKNSIGSIYRCKFENEFFLDHARHTRHIAKTKGRNKEVREDWRNCGESRRGGFGVVYKQTQETTGHYRAVKTIDKRMDFKFHYSRELLVMAILANVCVLTSEGNYSAGSLPPYGTLPLSNG